MSHNVVYNRLISNSGFKNVLTATENLGNKELYLRVDNLGYPKGVWKTNSIMQCTWNQTVNYVMTVDCKYFYFWMIYMNKTWTEDDVEQIKPVWVNSKVRLKHVVAMLSSTPWGHRFNFSSRGGFTLWLLVPSPPPIGSWWWTEEAHWCQSLFGLLSVAPCWTEW